MRSTTAHSAPRRSKVRSFRRERTELWEQGSEAGRKYQIALARPKEPAIATGYPVFYVLDADTALLTLADTVRAQEKLLGPAVVVGVGYPTEEEIVVGRTLDLTPPTDSATLPPKPMSWGELGGADTFLDFLLDELRPAIARRISIDPQRQAIFGHSLGGLFVLYALFTRSDSFHTYIAGSPSIWWGQKVILNKLPSFQTKQCEDRPARRLLITVGELEDRINPEEWKCQPKDLSDDPEKYISDCAMVCNAAALSAQLPPLGESGLDVDFALFTGETHNSVIPAYLARGARFVLSGWSV